MTKLLFLAGSTRKESFNKKLAKEACEIAKNLGVDAKFIDLKDYDMLIYNGDYEDENGLPPKAIELKKMFVECDGFFIASPEYNSSFSPVLKNSLDWISRKHEESEATLAAFAGKVAAISAASPGGFGGLRGLVPLRMMLGNIGVLVTPSQLAISFASKAFDGEKLVDENNKNTLNNVVKQLVETTKQLKN